MPILFSCPCGKELKVRDELAGQRVKCPGCGQVFLAPAEAEAPARNSFLRSSPWEPIYSRPVTVFESQLLEAFKETVGEDMLYQTTERPGREEALKRHKWEYAPLGATELPICFIECDATVGCILTTQGIYWKNPDGGRGHLRFADLSAAAVAAAPGWVKSYLTIGSNTKIDVSGISNSTLKPLAQFLNLAIEMSIHDPASEGPTEGAVAGAMAVRAKAREKQREAELQALEKELLAFVRRRLPGKKLLVIGLGFWDSGLTLEKVGANLALALGGGLLFGIPLSAPKMWDIGVFVATPDELCILTLVQQALDLEALGQALDLGAILKSPPENMTIERLPKKSVKVQSAKGADLKDIIHVEGAKNITVRFPEAFLRGNEQNAARLAACFMKTES